MDVSIRPERRLLRRQAGGRVGDRGAPDVAPLIALAYRFERHQVWTPAGQRAKVACQFFVRIVVIESEGVAHLSPLITELLVLFADRKGASCPIRYGPMRHTESRV